MFNILPGYSVAFGNENDEQQENDFSGRFDNSSIELHSFETDSIVGIAEVVRPKHHDANSL